jgi:Matrixin
MKRFMTRWVLWLILACAWNGRSAVCWAHGDACETFGGACSDDKPADGDSSILGQPIAADDPNAANQYVLEGGRWPQPGGKCTQITLTYSFQNMFDGALHGPGATPGLNGVFQPNGPPLPVDLIRHSIEQALGLWASVAPINYVEVPDNVMGHGQIRFRHVYINGTDPPDPQDPIAKALAYFPDAGSDLAGDVEFDESDPWQAVGTTHIPDLLGAATHEIGHTLGLAHTPVEGAVMYWIFHRFNGLGTGFLTPVDINGVQAIYGAGHGSVTPLSVPEPAPEATLIEATTVLFAAGWRRKPRSKKEYGNSHDCQRN